MDAREADLFCNFCKKPAHISCSRCMSTFYCDVEHQKSDWRNHKANCVAIPTYSPVTDTAIREERERARKPFQKDNYTVAMWVCAVVIPSVVYWVLCVLIFLAAVGFAIFTYGITLYGLALLVPMLNFYIFFLFLYEPVLQAIINLILYLLVVVGLSVTGISMGIAQSAYGGFSSNIQDWQIVGGLIVCFATAILRLIAGFMCIIGRIEVCVTERKCCFGVINCDITWTGKTRKAIMMTRSIHLAGVFVHVFAVVVSIIWASVGSNYDSWFFIGPISFIDGAVIIVNRVPDVLISIVRCVKRLKEPDDPPGSGPIKRTKQVEVETQPGLNSDVVASAPDLDVNEIETNVQDNETFLGNVQQPSDMKEIVY